ncbi:hypothetical protein ZYGR_0Z01040 [Zygosaccharomyces rouxii]|uniref:Uncharacterized protein n=1 Tax=Zygosaccharomyces rouxii TaxID=4956 RepID=A0A1Q3A4U6_ZYGRO|nr:hypothetical protein ZYGR_0Z01040 [Zygosaccharomyces rouxii]
MRSNGISHHEEELSKPTFGEKFGRSSKESDLNLTSDMGKGHHRNHQEKSNLNQEFPADLRPLGFKRHADPELSKTPKQPPASLAKVRERLVKNGGSNGAANAGTTENIIRGVLGLIDRDQFEEYLKNPPYIKLMKKGKNLKQFRRLFLAQELRIQGENVNGTVPTKGEQSDSKAIWVNKFSVNGKYMAAGSKDGSIWIWKVLSSPVERWEMDYKEEIHAAVKRKTSILQQHHNSNLPSNGSSSNLSKKGQKLAEKNGKETEKLSEKLSATNLYAPVFKPQPYRIYREHGSSVLDLDWSQNGFLVSASMDKAVKLWHVEREQSLKTFLHPDFVTCIKFYPLDDRFFVSGCLDHKCRMWSILDDEVIFEFDCEDLITSMVLTPETGDYTILGTFNGYIYILETYGLRLVSSFHVKDKETQNHHVSQGLSPGSKHHHGPRVTYLQYFKSPNDESSKLMTVSNDSRVRIFDLKTKKCVEILRGFESGASQHSAQLVTSSSQAIVVSGSNDHWVYGWKLQSASIPSDKLERNATSKRSGSIKRSGSLRNLLNKNKSKTVPESLGTDFKNDNNGRHNHRTHNPLNLKNIIKHGHNNGSDQYIKNNYSISFHAHHSPVTTANLAPPETSKALSLSNDLICELSSLLYKNDDELGLVGISKNLQKSSNDTSDDSDVEPTDWDSSINLPNDRVVPSSIDAIGTILITTDTTGLIRIFRADMPSAIRRRVLNRLENPPQNENPHKNKSGSTDSLTSIQNVARSNSLNGGINGLSSPQTANGHNSSTFSPQSASDSFNQPRPPLRNRRSCSVFRNALLSQSNTSIASLKRSSLSSNPGEGDRGRSNSSVGHRLRCDVCGGTKFNLLSRGSFSGRENGYYCTDCSTMNNSFR